MLKSSELLAPILSPISLSILLSKFVSIHSFPLLVPSYKLPSIQKPINQGGVRINSKKLIGLAVLIFVFVIACAGTSEKSGTEQLIEENESSNVKESWTGTWNVTGRVGISVTGRYVLVLRQDDNKVKSIRGSSFDFKGNVVGNQLKGRFKDDSHGLLHRLTLKMSEDLKSFEGKDYKSEGNVGSPVKGVRQD